MREKAHSICHFAPANRLIYYPMPEGPLIEFVEGDGLQVVQNCRM
jgi:hypothetical protein